jgi:sugar lactone lactonase YvrE
VVITNSFGSVTSSAAVLTVNELTAQPVSQTVVAGDTLVLSIGMAGGGPLRFQWQCNGTNLLNNLIRTVAGGSSVGFSGDGGPATNASLDLPGRIQFDRGGNLFIPDTYNSRVRKMDANGIITTVAGNGTAADSGDGGAATSASLYTPNDVAWDAAGNMYIGDYQHVRKVDTNGIITTATATVHNASGMAMDGLGRLCIAEFFDNVVCRLEPGGTLTTLAGTGGFGWFSGDGGAATQASLSGPSDVLLDAAGNLYIADSGNHRIRKVDTRAIITTVAGNGTNGYSGDGGPATAASLYHSQALTMDAQGNLFIADSSNNRVREVDTNGIITTVAGNGTSDDTGDGCAATNAGVSYPWGITFDSVGNLFFSTSYRVREVVLASSPTYVLNNVSSINAGSYKVIITSSSGSVTSQVATVTVLLRPSITSLVPQPNGTVVLSLTGTPNSSNRVWVTSDLTPPVAWAPISTNVAGADGRWQCTDSNAVGCSTRFYRASMP